MNKAGVMGLAAGAAALVCLAFAVVLLLVKALWAWTIPDLFPGAVNTGLVAAHISWYTAMKLSICLLIIAGGVRGSVQQSGRRARV